MSDVLVRGLSPTFPGPGAVSDVPWLSSDAARCGESLRRGRSLHFHSSKAKHSPSKPTMAALPLPLSLTAPAAAAPAAAPSKEQQKQQRTARNKRELTATVDALEGMVKPDTRRGECRCAGFVPAGVVAVVCLRGLCAVLLCVMLAWLDLTRAVKHVDDLDWGAIVREHGLGTFVRMGDFTKKSPEQRTLAVPVLRSECRLALCGTNTTTRTPRLTGEHF